jgi:hypothetical protein
MTSTRRIASAGLCVSAWALLFMLGRASSGEAEPKERTDQPAPPSDTLDRREPPAKRTSVPRLVLAGGEQRTQHAALIDQRKASATLLNHLLSSVRDHPQFGLGTPELVASSTSASLVGIASALRQLAPDAIAHLSDQAERVACKSKLAAEEIMVMGYLWANLPEATTPTGIDCAIGQDEREGAPLWSVLDAWRKSGFPESTALMRLRETATDSRTTRRFLNDEAYRAMRTAGLPREVSITSKTPIREPVGPKP